MLECLKNYKVLQQETIIFTLAPASYLRSLVVTAVNRHYTGLIPAKDPDEFFSSFHIHQNYMLFNINLAYIFWKNS